MKIKRLKQPRPPDKPTLPPEPSKTVSINLRYKEQVYLSTDDSIQSKIEELKKVLIKEGLPEDQFDINLVTFGCEEDDDWESSGNSYRNLRLYYNKDFEVERPNTHYKRHSALYKKAMFQYEKNLIQYKRDLEKYQELWKAYQKQEEDDILKQEDAILKQAQKIREKRGKNEH